MPYALSLYNRGLVHINITENLLFKIHYSKKEWKESDPPKFALLIKPVFKEGGVIISEIIEDFEFHILLGVSHIYFYNLSAPSAFDPVLDYYQKEGLLTLIQFYSSLVQKETRFHSDDKLQHTAQLDCLYRSMGKYRFLVYDDYDEIILPQKHASYHELYFQYLLKNPATEYMFLNVFHHLYFGDDPCTPQNIYNLPFSSTVIPKVPNKPECSNVQNFSAAAWKLLVARKTYREDTVQMAAFRSKLIVQSEGVLNLGTHLVLEFWPVGSNETGRRHIMPPDIGLLHHYRSETQMGGTILDRSSHRFIQKLGN